MTPSTPTPATPPRGEANYRGAERRKDPRAKAEFFVTLEAKDRRVEARVRDISRSGVAFTSKIPFTEMTVLRIDLAIPGHSNAMIRADGAVVRCAKGSGGDYDVAVFFTSIDDSARAAIAQFVSKSPARA